MSDKSKIEGRLKIACEIAADRVIAARATEYMDGVETCTVRTLDPGTVAPGLTNTNVVTRDSLVSALSETLSTIGTRNRDIVTVIPDAACRIALLDFDAIPDKPQDAEAVVRFRLKKSLPFDVDRAKLSYEVRRHHDSFHVIAVVALPSVVEEYESVVRDAGFNPGVVVPSSLAALGLVDASRPTLLVRIAANVTSLAVVHNDDLLLFRTIEGGAVDAAQLAEEIYPSLVFCQDTYGIKVERVLIDGAASVQDLAPTMESSTGIRVHELVDPARLGSAVAAGQRPFVSGTVGALIA